MTKTFCDRCGAEIFPSLPFMQAKIPMYSITKRNPYSETSVDLCNNCQTDFNEWLTRKEPKNEEA